jgi:hypothetical protein
MAGCIKISTLYAMIRVQHSHCCRLKMGTASGATLIRAGHHLKKVSGRLTQMHFYLI